MAYCIAGHHTGLANGNMQSDGRPSTPLCRRLAQAEKVCLPDWLCLPEIKMPVPFAGLQAQKQNHFAVQFFIRMLYSALVDADFLETENYYQPDTPRGTDVSLTYLRVALVQELARFGPPETDVNKLRAEVLERAGQTASQPPGFFSLTVPTGGGKTLASLKFALDHAIAHDMRRVIHVAPFTAIIEQTADTFRKALRSEEGTLEHHSAFQTEQELSETNAERMMLAAQNWDRPVVVTTAVQLFESLFANGSQKCRKLHNIAKSVIVLDEAQSLPVNFLRPCLAALKELVRGYGCSIVLCTATQPAIHCRDGLEAPEALVGTKTWEIAPNPAELFQRLKRVKVSQCGMLTNDDLIKRLKGKSALVIVNNKKQARALFDGLRGEGVFHLSTHMTATHRQDVLRKVREQLAARVPVLLIATALVEAGVDLDFPEVWRAVAGIDSIAQAAGRCNREGTMDGLGQVHVFEPEETFPPPPELHRNAEVARDILKEYPDPLTPEAVTAYFRRLYRNRTADLDAKGIMARINEAGGQYDYSFADIARDFHLIEDFTIPLIIAEGPYGMNADARKLLKYGKHAGSISRRLQPFVVQVTPRVRNTLVCLGAAAIERPDDFADQFVVLGNERLYDEEAGFSDAEPEDLGNLIV